MAEKSPDERGEKLPSHADLYRQLTKAFGDDAAEGLCCALNRWNASSLEDRVRISDFQMLEKRVDSLIKEVEDHYVAKKDLAKEIREEIKAWLKFALLIIAGVFTVITSLLMFFWEKIHPYLIGK